jgi:hypothetical protein
MKNLLIVFAPTLDPQESRFSVDFHAITAEAALRQIFTQAGVSFVIPGSLLEMVTLAFRQQTLETIVGKLLEQSPNSLKVQKEQEIWQVLPIPEIGGELISLELRGVPLRAALRALSPYLSGLRM